MFSTIKKLSFAVLFFLFTAINVDAQHVNSWKLDKSHTSVNFSINHFFSAVTGKFQNFDGEFQFDPDNLQASKASFTIEVNSINTDDSKRDKHLQSKDFFDAKSYPNLTFQSTKFEKKSNTDFLVHGKLTIKDITKEVILPMKITGQMEHPMKKGTIILGIVIDTSIDRTNYGVGTGDWAATMVVSDEARIHIPMELNRKK